MGSWHGSKCEMWMGQNLQFSVSSGKKHPFAPICTSFFGGSSSILPNFWGVFHGTHFRSDPSCKSLLWGCPVGVMDHHPKTNSITAIEITYQSSLINDITICFVVKHPKKIKVKRVFHGCTPYEYLLIKVKSYEIHIKYGGFRFVIGLPPSHHPFFV